MSQFKMTVVFLVALFVVVGCGNEQAPASKPAAAEGAAQSSAAAQPETPAAEAAKEPAAPAVKLDEQIVAAVKGAATCELNSSVSYKCEAYKAANETIKTVLKDASRAKGLFETLSVMVNDKDAKLAAVSGHIIGRLKSHYVYNKLQKSPDSISAETVDRLMQALAAADEKQGGYLAQATTHAATLSGALDKLDNAYKSQKNQKVKNQMLANMMIYGRMKTFDKVKEAAASAEVIQRRIAMKALLAMPKWTDEEQAVVCPWALGYIQDEDLEVAGSVAHAMVKCKHLENGKYIDAMLEEGKRRVGIDQWKKPFVWAYRDVCFGGFLGTDKKASEETCQKTYDFLEWVANQKNVEPWFRGFALSMIYYQRRDQTTYDLLAKYKKSKVKEIKEMVEKDMESLEKNYLKKK